MKTDRYTRPDNIMDAFIAGMHDRLDGDGSFGRTYDNQDMNEAYDRGMNFAEAVLS